MNNQQSPSPVMNIGLFAADYVGCEIARFFREKNEPLSCLILDARDPKGVNASIRANATTPQVFFSDQLTDPLILQQISQLELDLFILAWWPYIIKEPLISIPRLGCLNLHPSLLPYNRGKDPNFWSLVEETPFGVSIHFVDAGIDSGDIVFQAPIATSWEDTGKSLYDKSLHAIVKLFIENFDQIKRGHLPRRAQQLEQGSFHRRAELEPASQIELDKTYRARDLLNLLRARTFYPHPAAWFVDQGEKFEVRVEIKKVN